MEDSNYGEASQRTRAGIVQVRITLIAILSAKLFQIGHFPAWTSLGDTFRSIGQY
jgi:hypothetical protein